MSWGIRITTLYLGFVALIVTLVVTCFGHKTELESKDYYARELKFQQQITAEQNTSGLSEPIGYQVMDRSVLIFLPEEILNENISGTVSFLRPSDSSKDKTIPLSVDKGGQQLLSADFEKGVYKMRILLKSGNKEYYKEAVINFNK